MLKIILASVAFCFLFFLMFVLFKILKNIIKDFLSYTTKLKIVFIIGSIFSVLALIDYSFTLFYYGDGNNIPQDQIHLFFWFNKLAEILTIFGVGLAILTIVDTSKAQQDQEKVISNSLDRIENALKELEKLQKPQQDTQADQYRSMEIKLGNVEMKIKKYQKDEKGRERSK